MLFEIPARAGTEHDFNENDDSDSDHATNHSNKDNENDSDNATNDSDPEDPQ